MTITTLNSTYTLEDMGDGTFLMSGTNSTYFPGPLRVEVSKPPTVGECFWIKFLDGPRVGTWIHTSLVREVHYENELDYPQVI